MERPEYFGYMILNVASTDIDTWILIFIHNITYNIAKYRQVHIVEKFHFIVEQATFMQIVINNKSVG